MVEDLPEQDRKQRSGTLFEKQTGGSQNTGQLLITLPII